MTQNLIVQSRVIKALLFREVLTRYGRHNIGILWLAMEPMLFTLGIAALWYAVKLHTVSNIPIVAFALTGYSSVLVWRNSAGRSTYAIEVNLGLKYHRNVKIFDILFARTLLEIIGGTISFLLLTIAFVLLGLMDWPSDFMVAFGGWFLLCWFAVALSFIIGVIAARSELFDRFWHIATYLLFPVSGAMFMVDWLPKVAQDLVLLLPMVHGVEMVRHGFFGDSVRTHESPIYFIVCNLALTLLGLYLVNDVEKRVQPE